jgi:two-component system, chemotaxis family, sensor kinase CheA
VNGSAQLDELLAQEIERRLGPVYVAVAPESLSILLHTLRGSVAMAGHTDLALVIGQLDARHRQQEPGVSDIAIDFLRDIARRLRAGLPPIDTEWPVPPPILIPSVVDVDRRVEYRTAMLDRLNELDIVITLQESSHEGLEQAYRLVHSMKGTAGSVGDDTTAWYCHGLETRLRAALDDHQQSLELLAQLARHSGTIARLLDDPDEAFAMLRSLKLSVPSRSLPVNPSARPSAHPSSRPAPASWIDELDGDTDASLRVPSATVERLFDHLERVDVSAEELLGTASAANDLARKLRELNHELMEVRRATLPTHKSGGDNGLAYRLEYAACEVQAHQLEATRIASNCLKNSEVLRVEWAETRSALSHLRRTRMSWLFERVASAAQRFAQAERKIVQMHDMGGEISIERSVADRLLEAVMQVVRNAISHGISVPEARIAAGKPPHGLITARAERQGDWLRLTIDDDGSGVDVQRVRQLAIERGVVTQDAVRQLGEQEFFNLLFLPGLSTRRGADVLAGRGVGLDLARDIMRRLGGAMRLSSLATGGVRATFEFPIERGLVDVIWLVSEDHQFALPVTFTGRVKHRDPKAPAPTLAACVGLQSRTPGVIELEIAVPGVQPVAVGIDALGDVEEVIVRPLPPLLSQLGPYAGAILRGDGSLRLMLDAAIVAAELWSRFNA